MVLGSFIRGLLITREITVATRVISATSRTGTALSPGAKLFENSTTIELAFM